METAAKYLMQVNEAIGNALKTALQNDYPREPYYHEAPQTMICPLCGDYAALEADVVLPSGLKDTTYFCDDCQESFRPSESPDEIPKLQAAIKKAFREAVKIYPDKEFLLYRLCMSIEEYAGEYLYATRIFLNKQKTEAKNE